MEFKDMQHEDIELYFINKEKNGWDIKVKKTLLESWMKSGGLDEDKKIKIVIAEKNFQTNDRNG